jgi:hypothetical protein
MAILLIILRGIGMGIGAYFLYAAIFLYEDDRKKIQNRLDVLWLKVEELRDDEVSFGTAFLKVVAKRTSVLLKYIYGPKFITLRAFVASMCLSIISIAVVLEYVAFLEHDLFEQRVSILYIILICTLFVIFRDYFRTILIDCIGLLWCVLCIWIGRAIFPHSTFPLGVPAFDEDAYITLFCSILGSFVSDFLVIYLIRITLNYAVKSNRLIVLIAVALLMCCGVAILVFIPFYSTGAVMWWNHNLWQQSAEIIAMSNLLPALVLCFFFGLIITMILQRLVSPIISRLLYPIANDKVALNRKLLAGIGGAFISLSSKTLGEFIAQFIK